MTEAGKFIYDHHHLASKVAHGKQAAWLILNDECNWRCKHCYLPEHSRHRPAEEALTIAQTLVQQGLTIIPASGEVLLNPDYLAVYTAAHAKHLLTNGIALAAKNGKQLAHKIAEAGIEQVGFTLHEDGSYNFLNGVPPPVVAKAVHTVKEAGLVPTATTVITNQNYLRIPEICALAREVGMRAIRFNRLAATRPELVSLVPNPEQVTTFFQSLYEQRNLYRQEELGIYASGLFGLSGRKRDIPPESHYCLAGRQMVAVDIDNVVYPCLLLMTPERQIGNLDPTSGQIVLHDNDFTSSLHGKKECAAYELLYLNQGI